LYLPINQENKYIRTSKVEEQILIRVEENPEFSTRQIALKM